MILLKKITCLQYNKKYFVILQEEENEDDNLNRG